MISRLASHSIVYIMLMILSFTTYSEEPLNPDNGDSKTGSQREHQRSGSDPFEMSLQELMNLQVTSVSRSKEKASHAAAAVHVITGEDIRRAGVTSIPEALRMAPGVEVGRRDAHSWGITSRGFNSIFSNKLLVLMDGRSVYNPTFSGVFWDVQDTLLEDIDRIEVIRGPGAAIWGANAVNGVINIITKTAKDTQGGLITAGGGTEEHGFGSVRYGFKPSKDMALSVYGKFFNRADSIASDRSNTYDGYHAERGGFTFNWDASIQDLFTIKGDIYHMKERDSSVVGQLTAPFSSTVKSENTVSGGNVMGRWDRTISDQSQMMMQIYYDRTERESSNFAGTTDTFDMDFNYRLPAGDRHDLKFGGGYRLTIDDPNDTPNVTFSDNYRILQLLSAFIHDEITVVPDKLAIIIGSKFEYNSFTGFEAQPDARLRWTPHKDHVVWAGVTRAVRTPSRSEDDARTNAGVIPAGALGPGSQLTQIAAIGDKDYRSEVEWAWQLGYRASPVQRFSYDIATFINHYDDLRTFETGAPFAEANPAPAHQVLPLIYENKMKGITYGVELAANIQVTDWLILSAQYSLLRFDLDFKDSSNDTFSLNQEKRSPRHMGSLRARFNLPKNVELDLGVRHVSELENFDIPAYTVGDIRIGWKPLDCLDVSLIGQNLFDDRHPEFRFPGTPQSEVEHSVHLKITFKF